MGKNRFPERVDQEVNQERVAIKGQAFYNENYTKTSRKLSFCGADRQSGMKNYSMTKLRDHLMAKIPSIACPATCS